MREFTWGECPNCQTPVSNPRAIFCGERCRQIARVVRYGRSKRAEGTYERPDIAEAIRTQIAILVGGSFYDRRARSVAPEARKELRNRSGGRCEKCGTPFEDVGDRRFTVQHTRTGDGQHVLEAWCYRCNMDDANSKIVLVSDPDQIEFGRALMHRIMANSPLFICDDEKRWQRYYAQLRAIAAFWRRSDARGFGTSDEQEIGSS